MEDTPTYPIHQSLPFGSLLAAAAGGLDAYSYLIHGQVFAGLQTGNLILLGVNIGKFDWSEIGKYVISSLAFMIGAMVVRSFQIHFGEREQLIGHREYILIYELTLMIVVALISGYVPNLVATVILSMAAAAQLQEFQTLKGGPFTSLMMTGNLKNLAVSIHDGIFHHNEVAHKKAIDTLTIIGSFVSGALLVGLLAHILHDFSILVSIVFILMALMTLISRRRK